MQVHAPCPQASPFSFSVPSSWGQECLALFANLGDQYLVLLGDQSCSDSWPGYLGVFGGGAQYGALVWSQGCQTPALGPGQGKGEGKGLALSQQGDILRAEAMCGLWAMASWAGVSSWAISSWHPQKVKLGVDLSLPRPGKAVSFSTHIGHLGNTV